MEVNLNSTTKSNKLKIREGISLLKQSRFYRQKEIIAKLRFLGYKVSEATLSNILNDKKVGEAILHQAMEGIEKIVQQELGYAWNEHSYILSENARVQEKVIPGIETDDPALAIKPGFAFHEHGRWSIDQKVDFFSEARQRVIEFGTTLNTFTSYFYNRNQLEFKAKIIRLLERGIDYDCYLIDPDCNEARLYFGDRGRDTDDENQAIDKIRKIIHRLRKVQEEFEESGYPGKFRVYTYKHIPYNYFLAVDADLQEGRMLVSHYIYGESRANCPVLKIARKYNRSLFRKYWQSLQKLMQGAKSISRYAD